MLFNMTSYPRDVMPRHYYVYIVQLAPEGARTGAHRRAVAGGARIYYVGQTAVGDEARVLHHLRGGRGTTRAVQRYAIKLIGHDGPYESRPEAEKAERHWAETLRQAGHVVLGGR